MAIVKIFDNFVKKAGDSIFGNITMLSGANILTSISGVNTIGTASNPFEAVYANFIISSGSTGQFVDISGDTMTGPLFLPVLSGTVISGSSIFVDGDSVIVSGENVGTGHEWFKQKNGTNLEFKTVISGNNFVITSNANDLELGISSTPIFDIIFASVISGTTISGESIYRNGIEIDTIYVNSAGDTMTGDLVMDANIVPSASGTRTIGTPTLPFEAVYADDVVDTSGTSQFVRRSGDTMTGTLNVPVLSGTVISGNTITIDSLSGVLQATAGVVAGSATTTQLPEGTNLYYTDQRVNDNVTVSGHSLLIAQNTADITNVSGTAFTAIQSGINLGNGDDIFSAKNNTDLEFRTVSGVGNITVTIENDVVVFSGTGDGNGDVIGPATSTINAIALFTDTSGKLIKNSSVLVTGGDTVNANTISGTNVNTDTLTVDTLNGVLFGTAGLVSGSATTTELPEGTNLYYTDQRVNDNVTVSGHSLLIAQNILDITNVSGTAFTAIQSGVSVGTGDDIFSSKNGTNLEFRTVEGKGIVSITVEGDNVVFSGTEAGIGDVIGPASATDNAIVVYDGTTGKLIKDSAIIINPSGTLNATVVSGTIISGNNIFDSGNRVVTSVNSLLGPSVTLTTSDIAEGTNLYYTDQRVNDNVTVSGHSLLIAQNTADITNVSGTAFTAIQSGISLGAGDDIFSAKNNTDLEFRTVSGVGNVSVTVEGDVVVFSGTGDGNGDVIGPSSATNNSVALFDTTTGKLIKDSAVIINPSGVLNAPVISGTVISGESIFRQGSEINSNGILDLTSGEVTQLANINAITISNTQWGFLGATDQGLATTDDVTFNLVNAETISGTTISGDTIFDSGNRVVTSVNSLLGPSVTLTTSDIAEGTNLYYTEARVNANATVVQNTADILTNSGISATNITNIAQNIADITNVSGTAFTAVQNGVSLGDGDDIFSAKNGTDLEFRTVSGVGNIAVTIEGDVVVFSGTGDGNGDVIGPAGATDNAVALYDTTTGKLIKNSSVIVTGGDTLNANTISGTTISGNSVIINTLDGVLFGTAGLVSGSATTTILPEGTNLYYTEARVDANATVVQNTADILTNSGISANNIINISINTADILTNSGISATNITNIAQNVTDIANVSGTAFSAIQSGTSLGNGDDIFSAKNGTNLEFRTVSGVGNVSVTIESDVVVFSGTGDGNGDVVGPASATDNAIAVYDGTTGKLIKNSAVIIDPTGTVNANVISGTAISGNAVIARDSVSVSGITINHVFGTELNLFEELFVTTTTATSPQVKVSGVTATLPAGKYRIGWSYGWNHNATTTDFEGRILVDGTLLMDHKQEPADSMGVSYSGSGTDQKYRAGGHFYQDFASDAAHTFVMDYATSTGGDESSIWDARIEIWRTN